MLWALAHGWTVSVFSAPTTGSLWKDPARRRYLVYGAGVAPDLPALSDEVRARIEGARSTAAPVPEPLSA